MVRQCDYDFGIMSPIPTMIIELCCYIMRKNVSRIFMNGLLQFFLINRSFPFLKFLSTYLFFSLKNYYPKNNCCPFTLPPTTRLATLLTQKFTQNKPSHSKLSFVYIIWKLLQYICFLNQSNNDHFSEIQSYLLTLYLKKYYFIRKHSISLSY